MVENTPQNLQETYIHKEFPFIQKQICWKYSWYLLWSLLPWKRANHKQSKVRDRLLIRWRMVLCPIWTIRPANYLKVRVIRAIGYIRAPGLQVRSILVKRIIERNINCIIHLLLEISLRNSNRTISGNHQKSKQKLLRSHFHFQHFHFPDNI